MKELRNQLVDRLLRIVAAAGAVAYIPGMILSILDEVWPIAVADTLAFAAVLVLALRPGWPYRLKVAAVLVLTYGLGLALLVWTGPLGAGALFVFAFVFLATLFSEMRGLIAANVVAVVTYAVLTVGSALGWVGWEQPIDSVLVILSNFLLISVLLSGAAHFLLQGLSRAAGEERRLRESNELLLREIEHRVKNNLQVISSLVAVRSRSGSPEQALGEVRDSLAALAAVQHLLHRRDYQYHVKISELLTALTERFRAFYDPAFLCRWTGPEAEASADKAAVIGLLYNEIVMNAQRHAWKHSSAAPLITVDAQCADGRLTLTIGDNGEGMKSSEGSGRKIIRALAHQLAASMEIMPGTGVRYRFTWSVSPATD